MLLKGVSEVIAMVMMLVITLALAGTAYVFISGAFTRQTQGIEVVDSYCSGGTVRITIRNIGTSTISRIDWERISPGSNSSYITNLAVGDKASFEDNCEPGKTCVYRIIPNIGRVVPVVVQCT